MNDQQILERLKEIDEGDMDDIIGTAIVALMVAGLFARDISKWFRRKR